MRPGGATKTNQGAYLLPQSFSIGDAGNGYALHQTIVARLHRRADKHSLGC